MLRTTNFILPYEMFSKEKVVFSLPAGGGGGGGSPVIGGGILGYKKKSLCAWTGWGGGESEPSK